jgi:hypothetical protein
MPLVNGDLKLIQVNGSTKFEERTVSPTAGHFLKFGAGALPTSSAIAISDVTNLTTTLTGKQAQSDRLDNFVSATAPGIIRIDAANGITVLSSTSFGEGLLNTADASAARTYLGIGSVLGSLQYQGVLNSQGGFDALPTATSGNKGYYYVASTVSTTEVYTYSALTLGNGDWIVSNGTAWEKVNSEINDNEITTSKIVNLAITTAKLADDAVTTVKILNANVTAAKLASDSVTTVKILDANVTAAKLASDSVTTVKILDNNVTTAKIADDAITTVKILDSNVTASKLATDSVSTAKIIDANVTAAKLAADSVTTAKILNSNVTLAKLQDIATGTILANFTGSTGAPTAYATSSVITNFLQAATAAEARGDIGALGWSTAPTTATDTGTAGQIAYDVDYFYICVATDTWVRVPIATW